MNNYQKLINENRALGEIDHPNDSIINLKNVSHCVVEASWQGRDVIGKIKILETPSGKIARSLIESGIPLGISSRALGSVREENGRTVVEDDLQIICYDLVGEPSVQGAVLGLMEAKNKPILTKSDRLNRILNEICGV